MAEYVKNHYVPEWYQKGFIPDAQKVKDYKYLCLYPEASKDSKGNIQLHKALYSKGPGACFYENNLYTSWFRRSPK